MRFKKFLLDNYCLCDEGKKMLKFFSNLESLFANRRSKPDFYQMVNSWLDDPNAEEVYSGNVNAEDLRERPQVRIPCESVLAYCSAPDINFPYLFPKSFYKLEEICLMFEIQIPALPPKTDYKARYEYYRKLSDALTAWRVNEGLSPIEFCVFLYGFALKYAGSIIQSQRGRTKRIYLLIASPEDQKVFVSENYRSDRTQVWQGCEEMRPGDIALMWERKPKSRMTSVWDILSSGFDDPFAYYSGRVYIGNCRRIPEISFKELESNPIWHGTSLVKCHLQSRRPPAVSSECYDAIKQIVLSKDAAFDCSVLPSTPETIDFSVLNIQKEHDVETRLLEPFLKELGFVESDWRYQDVMRIGRANSARPDYIVNFRGQGDHKTADFVFEAKETISTDKQLKRDYGQVYAYAKLYYAKIVSLVAKEGVWIFHGRDRFEFPRRQFFAWTDIRHPDVMSKLKIMFS